MGLGNGKYVLMNAASVRDLTEVTGTVHNYQELSSYPTHCCPLGGFA